MRFLERQIFEGAFQPNFELAPCSTTFADVDRRGAFQPNFELTPCLFFKAANQVGELFSIADFGDSVV